MSHCNSMNEPMLKCSYVPAPMFSMLNTIPFSVVFNAATFWATNIILPIKFNFFINPIYVNICLIIVLGLFILDSPLACIVAVVRKIIIGGINFSVIDKHSNAWEEDKLGPWACRTTHRNNCFTTCTATSTATSTSSTCIDSSTGAMMSGRNNNQFRRGAAIRRHIEN
nr:PREDICTED: uncharacterized protein LOC109032468 [Bemisia tabaci]